jgi:glutathione synthase/RimK-type ligase-like ATP-grasp enzyme
MDTEYRVFVVKNRILPMATIKTITINDNSWAQIKTHSAVWINDSLRVFIEGVQKRIKFDLVGYDVAKLKNGQYKIIEVNRSPQFLAYHRETNINVIEELLCEG